MEECSVSISGPSEVGAGETVTFTAEGNPPGGTYAWSPLPGLEPDGFTARFTGQAPGDVTIEIAYSTPDGETCTGAHTVIVSEGCSVTLSGPSEVRVFEKITLTAEGSPPGGTYGWPPLPGLVASGSEALFMGRRPGEVAIQVTYAPPDGEPCTATHTVTVIQDCSVTVSGPSRVRVCETITLTAEGDPPGGSYTWADTPGLVSNGSTAQLTGQTADDVIIEVVYRTPDGKPCIGTHGVTVLEQCPELKVPLYKQNGSPWGEDTYDHTDKTIRQKGCALTSAVMVLRYYGVTKGIDGKEVNPRNLNEWLNKKADGYFTGGSVNWWAVAEYSGGNVVFVGLLRKRNDRLLSSDLCRGRLVLLRVSSTHFVVAKGNICLNNERTWSINDPGRKIASLKGYGNKYLGLRRFSRK
ncbi:MAG: C39 family peptidase [Deltaproteobacteria bacterium]|nr:C39 family peptidase [Deltaproteobacteria bacterium]